MKVYSNGKLLITGEYLVLNGAEAFALPLSCGQSLNYKKTSDNLIKWNSYDLKNNIWFSAIIDKDNLQVIDSSSSTISKRLNGILKSIRNYNPEFLNENGCEIETKLNFDKDWGLGSSSTLIYHISKLANVDPYLILNQTFGGSGYDIACSNVSHPILYSLNNKKRVIHKVEFNPPFKDNIYFI
ncbi:MAG: GHMP kinase, partial [Pelagibacterales bacterium]|nr:GHMP kinase [Pelagibacterales bacterium]